MNQEPVAANGAGATVVVLSNDLFFAMRIRNALKAMEYRPVIAKSESAYTEAVGVEDPVLGLVDFNHPLDWDALAPVLADASFPTIAFGPHKDTNGFAAARAAGVSRVISNGAFSTALPDLIQKYAKRAG